MRFSNSSTSPVHGQGGGHAVNRRHTALCCRLRLDLRHGCRQIFQETLGDAWLGVAQCDAEMDGRGRCSPFRLQPRAVIASSTR
jgi:hypothetical protein